MLVVPRPNPRRPCTCSSMPDFPHAKVEIALWIPSAWWAGAMQGELPKKQSRALISSPPTSPTTERLEHKGGTLGLLVTTVPSVRIIGPSKRSVKVGAWVERDCRPRFRGNGSSSGVRVRLESWSAGERRAVSPAWVRATSGQPPERFLRRGCRRCLGVHAVQ